MKTPLKFQEPKPEHAAFYDDFVAVLGRHTHIPNFETLAVVSQIVGRLVALQDQRTITPQMAMDLVSRNIELGNKQVIDGLLNPKGRA